MKRLLDRISFKGFALVWCILVFISILIRAIYVPISHDEAATFLHYIQQGEFFPFYAHWDANNHALNSLLGIIMYETLGADLVWLRLPNVLSFLLFAYFGYRIISPLESKAVRISSFMALTLAWMPFEFFAQCRGYGLGLAFLLAGLSFLQVYFKSGKPIHQIALWISFSLALFANLSLSNSYLLCLGLVLLTILFHAEKRTLKNTLCLIFLGIVPFIGFSIVSFTMKEKGLLYYGEGTGFIDVTVRTLSAHTLATENPWVLYFIVYSTAAAIIIVLADRKWLRSFRPNENQLIALILFGNIAGTLLLNYILDVNFPEDRVGIYYIPLFILVLAMAIDRLARRSRMFGLIPGVALLLIFPVITAANSKLKQVHVWRQIPLDRVLFEVIAERSKGLDRTPMVSAYKLFPLSWAYENLKTENPLPPMTPREYDSGLADFHICYQGDCDLPASVYQDITPEGDLDVRLLERIYKVEFDTLSTNMVDQFLGDWEYFNLLETRDTLQLAETDAIHLDFSLASELDPCTIDLVITTQDANEGTLSYDFTPLHWVRDQWKGERLTFTRPVNFDGSEKRVICYLWNRNKKQMEISKSRVSLLRATKTSE